MVYLLLILIVVFDQLFKYLVISNFNPGESLPVINNVFHLTYVQNTGAAFGVLRDRSDLFILITLIVIIGLFYYFRRMKYNDSWFKLASGLVLGGAIGNLIDRIRLGYVVDYLDFRIWPVFNLADSAVVVGTILLVIYLWKAGAEERDKEYEIGE